MPPYDPWSRSVCKERLALVKKHRHKVRSTGRRVMTETLLIQCLTNHRPKTETFSFRKRDKNKH